MEEKILSLEKKIAYLEGQINSLLQFKANQQQQPYYYTGPMTAPCVPTAPYVVTCHAP